MMNNTILESVAFGNHQPTPAPTLSPTPEVELDSIKTPEKPKDSQEPNFNLTEAMQELLSQNQSDLDSTKAPEEPKDSLEPNFNLTEAMQELLSDNQSDLDNTKEKRKFSALNENSPHKFPVAGPSNIKTSRVKSKTDFKITSESCDTVKIKLQTEPSRQHCFKPQAATFNNEKLPTFPSNLSPSLLSPTVTVSSTQSQPPELQAMNVAQFSQPPPPLIPNDYYQSPETLRSAHHFVCPSTNSFSSPCNPELGLLSSNLSPNSSATLCNTEPWMSSPSEISNVSSSSLLSPSNQNLLSPQLISVTSVQLPKLTTNNPVQSTHPPPLTLNDFYQSPAIPSLAPGFTYQTQSSTATPFNPEPWFSSQDLLLNGTESLHLLTQNTQKSSPSPPISPVKYARPPKLTHNNNAQSSKPTLSTPVNYAHPPKLTSSQPPPITPVNYAQPPKLTPNNDAQSPQPSSITSVNYAQPPKLTLQKHASSSQPPSIAPVNYAQPPN